MYFGPTELVHQYISEDGRTSIKKNLVPLPFRQITKCLEYQMNSKTLETMVHNGISGPCSIAVSASFFLNTVILKPKSIINFPIDSSVPYHIITLG